MNDGNLSFYRFLYLYHGGQGGSKRVRGGQGGSWEVIRLNMVVWYCLFTYIHTFYIHSILFILGVVQRDRERGQWLVQGEQDLVHRDQLGYLALPLVMVELFSLVVQLEEEVQLMLSP